MQILVTVLSCSVPDENVKFQQLAAVHSSQLRTREINSAEKNSDFQPYNYLLDSTEEDWACSLKFIAKSRSYTYIFKILNYLTISW